MWGRIFGQANLTRAAGASVALLMATTALSGPAFAASDADQAKAAPATASDASASNDDSSPKLETVVVTADRQGYGADLVQVGSFRGARQIDTPLTVSVITDALIKSQQAQSLLAALQNTAGVTSSQVTTTVYSNLAIRGIDVENRGNYRLDGSLPIVNLIDLPLEDKARVEALKGASALYYGFTAPSGIINLTMKRPTMDPFVNVTVFGNEYGGIGGHIDASGSYGMFGARVNAVYADVNSGIDYTAGTRSLLSGAFDFRPTQNLTFSLDVEHIFKELTEPGIFHLKAPASTIADPYPSVELPPLIDPTTNFGPSWGKNHAEETNLLLRGTWAINDSWALTVDGGMSNLRRQRRFSRIELTNYATGDGNLLISLQDRTYQNVNARAELAGTFYTGPLLHEVLIGTSENVRDQYSSPTGKALCGGVTCKQNIFNPVAIPETQLPLASPQTDQRIDDIGYYAFDRIKYQDWLQVLGGLRYSDYTESNQTAGTTSYHATPLSYSYGVVVKPRDWASIYGTYIEGLESTAPAPLTAVNSGQQLSPSVSTQWEGGVKVEPQDGLLLTAAYFIIDRDSTYVDSSNVYVKDGRARYEGVELSATGEVTEDLSLYASALFLDAKQATGAPTKIVGTKITPTIVGKRIDNTAKVTLSVAGEYRLSNWVPGLAVSGGVYYVGKRAVNPLNQAFVPSYTIVDLGASYTTEGLWEKPVTFRINATNVGDERYWASTGGLYLAESAPSMVKFSISTGL